MAHSQFYIIHGEEIDNRIVRLGGSESHHLSRVSRVRMGEEVNLLDGRGGIYRAVVQGYEDQRTVLKIVSEEKPAPRSTVDIALALIKINRLDMAVEKCTELGVRRIIPFTCRHSVWRGSPPDGDRKLRRLKRKVEAAAKQSGQPWFPEISPLEDIHGVVRMIPGYERAVLASREPGPNREAVEKTAGRDTLGIVGPEGGLTGEETDSLLKAGAVTLSLGTARLRSETAAICLAAKLLGL
ncbi:MAG: 16S rRNA (uracil(1498)-N(3))-methyltransferase [Candidatus Krumholzibacteriota bacterium]|nr:16S rRNA (uracil(1498)-N(3))-methyltransferase [Candidatus Krumholzibacteriota bacterium]